MGKHQSDAISFPTRTFYWPIFYPTLLTACTRKQPPSSFPAQGSDLENERSKQYRCPRPPHAARILPEIYIQLIYTLIVAYVIVEPFEK